MLDPATTDSAGGDSAAQPRTVACPFHDGPETLDLLLAELRNEPDPVRDAALDLRSVMTARTDAGECLALLFALRAALDGRHHLALYRVRCWVRAQVVAEVRVNRAAPWQACPIPPACARLDELANACLATLSDAAGGWPPTAQLRFRFVTPTESVSSGPP